MKAWTGERVRTLNLSHGIFQCCHWRQVSPSDLCQGKCFQASYHLEQQLGQVGQGQRCQNSIPLSGSKTLDWDFDSTSAFGCVLCMTRTMTEFWEKTTCARFWSLWWLRTVWTSMSISHFVLSSSFNNAAPFHLFSPSLKKVRYLAHILLPAGCKEGRDHLTLQDRKIVLPIIWPSSSWPWPQARW